MSGTPLVAGSDRVVTLEYTVRLEDGRLLDSTGQCGPITVLFGAGQLLAPLEERATGMRPGETRELRIPAEEAYGTRREELVRTIPRERLPPDLELVVGAQYRLKTSDGRALRFRLLEMGDAEVLADFNSPNAGQALIATVTVIAVRLPTPEEERRGRA